MLLTELKRVLTLESTSIHRAAETTVKVKGILLKNKCNAKDDLISVINIWYHQKERPGYENCIIIIILLLQITGIGYGDEKLDPVLVKDIISTTYTLPGGHMLAPVDAKSILETFFTQKEHTGASQENYTC